MDKRDGQQTNRSQPSLNIEEEEEEEKITIEELFQDKLLREEFKKYSKQCLVSAEFDFFLKYQNFQKNNSKELSQKIYEEFVQPKGIRLISMSYKTRQKVDSFYNENDISSCLNIVYKQVINSKK